MNSTFKVVFNKARGALMVVNEATSSIQAKGTKTVIASALLSSVLGMVANNAAAEANPTTISKDTLITIADKVPAYNATTVTLENGATLTLQGKTNQHGFFSEDSSVVGNGSLILNSTGTGDIGASLGEGVKNIDVNSLKITSEAYGIYKSNTGACDAQIKAKNITVNAVDHAFYTDTHSVAFEDFDNLTFTSKEGHALQNNSLSANVSFKGGDVSLISEGRGALSTMRSDKAITSFDVNNLTIQATINTKRSGATSTTDDIRKSSAVFVDQGTLNATVQESISIIAKQGNGDAPYAVYVTNGGKLNFKTNQMTFNSDARTICGSGSGTSIHLDGEQVNVNSKSIGVIGLAGAQVVIDGKELNIDVANDTGWLGGLWTQNNTSQETIPAGATKLQVNAENTNIKVTATGESANAIGIVAFSNSTIEVTGNLKVDADSVIRSRG